MNPHVIPGEQAWAQLRSARRLGRWPTRAEPQRLSPLAAPDPGELFALRGDEKVFCIGSCFARDAASTLAMLNEIHEQFIAVVRAGRGKRLKENPEIFSGLYWTGAKAVEMGLADGFGTVDTVARDVVKAEDIID